MGRVTTDSPTTAVRPGSERLSLMTKVARLYHEQGVRQPEIADRLGLSQSRVSRLLKEAVTLGIVRTVVVSPLGTFTDLEDAVRDRFGLRDVVVAESSGDDEASTLSTIGSAAASYLEATLRASDTVGISSWSSSLLATVDAMMPRPQRAASTIVQVIGGVGNPSVQVKATHLTERLASVTGAEPLFLAAPGVVASKVVRDSLIADPYIASVAEMWSRLTVLLVGVGSLQPSPLLKDSGNTVSDDEMARLRELGAVGDVCLRFFDAEGRLVHSALDDRVLGLSVDELRSVPRRVGVAGGARKVEAVRAALHGGWLDVLVTDDRTARSLLD
jgi:DNA-binding transcriptional regulator LsrR (DeoR family)